MKRVIRIAAASIAGLALAGCGTTGNLSTEEGRLAGAGAGALIGAVASGGVLLPALGAVGGAIVGEQFADPEPDNE